MLMIFSVETKIWSCCNNVGFYLNMEGEKSPSILFIMNNEALKDLIVDAINTIYYAMNQNRCIPDIESDLYQAARQLERVVSELERQQDSN